MSIKSRYSRTFIAGLVAAMNICGTAGVGHAQSKSPVSCAAWALQDTKDGTGYMFGAGGINCAHKQRWIVSVHMFRSGKLLAKSHRECYAKSCASHTRNVLDRWEGRQEWCTWTLVKTGISSNPSYREWNCAMH